MHFNCNVPLYVGPLFVGVGSFTLLVGTIALGISLPPWLRWADRFVEVNAAGASQVQKVLFALIGAAFVLVGLTSIWGMLHCRSVNFGIPKLGGSWSFMPWPRVLPGVLVALAIGVYSARQLHCFATRMLLVIVIASFEFAGAQAAYFHVGRHSAQWFAVGTACWVLGVGVWMLDRALARNNGEGS